LLFDFTAGSTNVGDGSANSTFYFDEIKYANVPLNFQENNIAELKVYPNPTVDHWMISNPAGSTMHIQLYDSHGSLLRSHSSQSSLVIDASTFASGLYLAKVKVDGTEQFIRLIKQ